MHKPVLLKEVIKFLDPKDGEFFIDGTFGGGGHSQAILEKVGPKGKLLGVDLDKSQIVNGKLRFSHYRNVVLVQGNYTDLPEILKNEKLDKADGLLLDLGFSSNQLESGRGFTFQKDEVLDMRYAAQARSSKFKTQNLTAAEVVNQFSEKDLADIFWKYGEERFARKIAQAVITERRRGKIMATFQLVELINRIIPRRGKINPATKTFQALRIYVNDELGNLEKVLKNLEKIIKNKGRLAIISFHSLEDRIVKNSFRELARGNKAKILTKKPIIASPEDIKENPRARSAKLRAIQLI